jgi:hypothetical protein
MLNAAASCLSIVFFIRALAVAMEERVRRWMRAQPYAWLWRLEKSHTGGFIVCAGYLPAARAAVLCTSMDRVGRLGESELDA